MTPHRENHISPHVFPQQEEPQTREIDISAPFDVTVRFYECEGKLVIEEVVIPFDAVWRNSLGELILAPKYYAGSHFEKLVRKEMER